MEYYKPDMVVSPKGKLSDLKVIVDGGATKKYGFGNGYSLACFTWEGKTCLGIRWNGSEDALLGTPQSRGIPTWFVLPDSIAHSIYESKMLNGSLNNILKKEMNF